MFYLRIIMRRVIKRIMLRYVMYVMHVCMYVCKCMTGVCHNDVTYHCPLTRYPVILTYYICFI